MRTRERFNSLVVLSVAKNPVKLKHLTPSFRAGYGIQWLLNQAALARRASYFFLRSQEKVSKKKATPLPLVPSVLAPHLGRLWNSCFQHSNSPRRLPSAAQAEGAARGNVILWIQTYISKCYSPRMIRLYLEFWLHQILRLERLYN